MTRVSLQLGCCFYKTFPIYLSLFAAFKHIRIADAITILQSARVARICSKEISVQTSAP